MLLRWNIKQTVVIVGIVVLASLALKVFFNEYKTSQIKQAQSSPSALTDILLKALVANDETVLRSIVAPEHQDEVTKWLSTHSPYYCMPILIPRRRWMRIKHARIIQASTGIGDLNYADDLNTAYINGAYGCQNSFSYQDFQTSHLRFC